MKFKITLFLALLLIILGIPFIFKKFTTTSASDDFWQPTAVYVSSQLPGWEGANLIDGKVETNWSSEELAGPETIQWASFDLSQPRKVAQIILVPRVWNNQIQAFPINFNFSYSDDGTNWQIIPGREFTEHPRPLVGPGGSPPELAFPINETHRYFSFGVTKASTDSYGGYFVQMAEVHFQKNECFNNPNCGAGEVCSNGVCGIQMEPYWNLKPGNHWIYKGTDYRGGSPLNFRERFDVEQKVRVCGDKDVLPLRMTRDVLCPEPHFCYWGNARFMFKDPEKDPLPYIWAFSAKWYNRDPNHPYSEIGTLRQREYFEPEGLLPSYFYTPKFLLDPMFEYRYSQKFHAHLGSDEGDLCTAGIETHYWAKLVMRYKNVNITTSGFQGGTIMISQGEQGSPNPYGIWCTREDWYLAKNIGIVKEAQWTCNDPAACYDGGVGNCKCEHIDQYNPSDHPNCFKNIALQNPAMVFELEKYYLGHALDVKVNGQTSIKVKPGETFTIDITDPSTGFTFDGFLETQSDFISPDGSSFASAGKKWNTWIENGKITVQLSPNFPPGTYKTKLRKWIFIPPEGTTTEIVTGSNNLPWSNEITVDVAISLTLSSGWNQITWPDVSGYKASDTPAVCPVAVAKERFWFIPYVKNFGGVDFNFEKDKVYYLKCNQTASWNL